MAVSANFANTGGSSLQITAFSFTDKSTLGPAGAAEIAKVAVGFAEIGKTQAAFGAVKSPDTAKKGARDVASLDPKTVSRVTGSAGTTVNHVEAAGALPGAPK